MIPLFQIELEAIKWLMKEVKDEVLYLAEVNDKVEELQSEVEWMQCFLWDANEKQKTNATVRKWVSDIRELALRAEDVIETYMLKVSYKKRMSNHLFLFVGSINIGWFFHRLRDAETLHKVGSEIDYLSARLSKLSSRLQIYGVAISNVSRQLPSARRQIYSYNQENAIGIEGRIKQVLEKLNEKGKKMAVIHGMSGIGKTTLARSLYHDPSIKGHFDCFAWAYLSQNFQRAAVYRDVLLQLVPGERETVKELHDFQVLRMLTDVLKNNKCLVILDDVWFGKDGDQFVREFPLDDGNYDTKLLVTTRDANIPSGHGHNWVSYYRTELLDENESRKLFEQKAGFMISKYAGTLKSHLVRNMLVFCNGHPLVIVVVAGALATMKTNEEWQYVHDHLRSHLEGNELNRVVYDVLAMSYYELSNDLKYCFLFLAYYPENFEIPVEKVYNLWIVEGLVSLSEDQNVDKRSLEEIAKDCLDELILRGMVQVGKLDYEEKISSCRLHDLMRVICLKMAKEQNFLQIDDRQVRVVNGEWQPTRILIPRARRLGIYLRGQSHDDIQKCLPNPSPGEVPLLRSILFFPIQKGHGESCKWMSTAFKYYKLLRILDCTGLYLTGSLPNGVGNLIYLRYLSLAGTRVTKLPSSIGNLRSLMVLDLRVSKVIIKVPNVLWKLKSLRKLCFPSRTLSQEDHAVEQGYAIKGGGVLNLDNLIYLEKLQEVNLDTVEVEGLVRLSSITELSATCESKKESLELILRSSNIQSLSLKISADMLGQDPNMLSQCLNLKKLHIDYSKNAKFRLQITPEMFPENLIELGFWYCKLQEDDIIVLAELRRLKILELHLCYDGKTLTCPHNAFPELVYLALDGLCNLKEWKMENACCKLIRSNVISLNSPIDRSVFPTQVYIKPRQSYGYREYHRRWKNSTLSLFSQFFSFCHIICVNSLHA